MSNGAVEVKWDSKTNALSTILSSEKHETGKVDITFAAASVVWRWYLENWILCDIGRENILIFGIAAATACCWTTTPPNQQFLEKAENFSRNSFVIAESSICIVWQTCLIFFFCSSSAEANLPEMAATFHERCLLENGNELSPVFYKRTMSKIRQLDQALVQKLVSLRLSLKSLLPTNNLRCLPIEAKWENFDCLINENLTETFSI